MDREPQRFMFFDNEQDPYQTRNLAGTASFPDEQDRLFGRLAAFHTRHPGHAAAGLRLRRGVSGCWVLGAWCW